MPSRSHVAARRQGRAKIGKCARFVAEQSVQLHGAMGVTEELDIGSYFKRLLAFDAVRRQRPSLSPPRRPRRPCRQA